MSPRSPLTLAVLVAALGTPLAGCRSIGPDYERPEIALPDAWHRDVREDLAEGSGDLRRWWAAFEDPVLDELIDRAAEGNLDLAIAAARVKEARGLRRVAEADRVPTVDMTGSASREKFSGATNPLLSGSTEVYHFGFDATWELDVWGRVARSVEAATADLQASEEALRDLHVILFAEVARNYVDLRTAQERARFASTNATAQESTLQLVNDRFDVGLVNSLDISQAEMNLARTQSVVPTFRLQATQSAHRIAVLLGEQPGAVYKLLGQDTPIPSSEDVLEVGIPADVLRRRPDVRQAERSLAAQTARIGVSEANLYPQFALTGNFGWDALKASDIFSNSAEAWGFGIPFRWNLFDRGRIKGDIAAQEARAEALQASYEQTVLLALEEVENAMVALTEERRRIVYLEASVAAAESAVSLVRDLYNQGLTDFQPVLDSERTLAEQQDALASSRGLLARDLIALYSALGGGWDPDGGAAPEPGAAPDAVSSGEGDATDA